PASDPATRPAPQGVASGWMPPFDLSSLGYWGGPGGSMLDSTDASGLFAMTAPQAGGDAAANLRLAVMRRARLTAPVSVAVPPGVLGSGEQGTPVPELASLALCVAGIGGLAVVRRRRGRQA